jgi:hypothetical protein
MGSGQETSMIRPHDPPSIFHHLQDIRLIRPINFETIIYISDPKTKLAFARSQSSEKMVN